LLSFPAEGTVRGFLKLFAPEEFRPDEISILEDALDDAWRRVESSKAPWASDDYSAVGRTILAKYIITMAKGGERDAKWLADSALLYLSQQKLTRRPPETV
jgi:hypothetical protein